MTVFIEEKNSKKAFEMAMKVEGMNKKNGCSIPVENGYWFFSSHQECGKWLASRNK
jgi:hypothetical protein